MVLLGVLFGAYYLFGFLRLSREAAALDRPLVNVWERYLATNAASQANVGLDLRNPEEAQRQLRASASLLEKAGRLVQSRVELPKDLEERMRDPFQLLDFQDERHQKTAQLARLAAANGVALEPGATNGLPEYAIDMPQPAFLWPRLHLANQLLLSAVHCKVSALKSLTQLPALAHRSTIDDAVFLQELPMRLELVGPMDAVSRFLVSLALRGPELKTVGLAEALTNKPALFIDHLLLRKHSAERPHEVSLDLTVSGFARPVEPRIGPAVSRTPPD